ncbi:hypothetical protein AURANDRAFT_68636, partial [Aureococcus anophagefferens]
MSFLRMSEADRAAAQRKKQQQKEFLEAQMVDQNRSRAAAARQANAELIKEREMLGLEAGDAADLIEARDRRLRKRAVFGAAPEDDDDRSRDRREPRSRDRSPAATPPRDRRRRPRQPEEEPSPASQHSGGRR